MTRAPRLSWGVVALLVSLAATCGAAARLRVRTPDLATKVRLLDALSGRVEHADTAELVAWWRERFPLEPGERARLDAWRTILDAARERLGAAAEDEALPWGTAGVLPPVPGADAEEALLLAALESRSVRGFAARLGAPPEDRAALDAALVALEVPLAEARKQAGGLTGARRSVEADVRALGASGFLAQMARFYGVADRVADDLWVDLLWTPPTGSFRATQVGNHMWIPLAPDVASDPDRRRRALEVVVHELGHYLFSLQDAATRAWVATRLVHEAGVPNPGRINLLDEALQTTFGTFLFGRDRLELGRAELARSQYGLLEGQPFPDAVDSLARAYEAPLRQVMGSGGGFAAFLDQALAAQARVLGQRPRDFAAVCWMFAPHPAVQGWAQGLFPARWRQLVTRPGALAEQGRAHPGATRWALMTRDDMRDWPRGLAEIDMAQARAAKGRLDTPEVAAVFSARRRKDQAGYDMLLIAEDAEDMRRMLLKVHRAGRMPAAGADWILAP